MRITVHVTPEATQFNLQPESSHEVELLGVIANYDGEVTVSKGTAIALSKGSYLHAYHDEKGTICLTIKKK